MRAPRAASQSFRNVLTRRASGLSTRSALLRRTASCSAMSPPRCTCRVAMPLAWSRSMTTGRLANRVTSWPRPASPARRSVRAISAPPHSAAPLWAMIRMGARVSARSAHVLGSRARPFGRYASFRSMCVSAVDATASRRRACQRPMYLLGIGLSGRSESQKTDTIHQRSSSFRSCTELIPRLKAVSGSPWSSR